MITLRVIGAGGLCLGALSTSGSKPGCVSNATAAGVRVVSTGPHSGATRSRCAAHRSAMAATRHSGGSIGTERPNVNTDVRAVIAAAVITRIDTAVVGAVVTISSGRQRKS